MKDNKSLHNDYYYYNIVRINIKKHRMNLYDAFLLYIIKSAYEKY